MLSDAAAAMSMPSLRELEDVGTGRLSVNLMAVQSLLFERISSQP